MLKTNNCGCVYYCKARFLCCSCFFEVKDFLLSFLVTWEGGKYNNSLGHERPSSCAHILLRTLKRRARGTPSMEGVNVHRNMRCVSTTIAVAISESLQPKVKRIPSRPTLFATIKIQPNKIDFPMNGRVCLRLSRGKSQASSYIIALL